MIGRMAKSGGTSKKQVQAPRANRARAVSDIVPDIGRAAFRRFGFVQSSIVSRWREIVGERYASGVGPDTPLPGWSIQARPAASLRRA